MVTKRDRDGWESIGVAIEYPIRSTNAGRPPQRQGFLNYDGTMSPLYVDPPNQHYQLQLFRAHAARFAHQLDAAMGHHSLQAAPRNQTGSPCTARCPP